MDARLTNLETKVAFQDDLVESLNGIVAAQQQQIELLQQQVQILYDQLRSLSPSNIESAGGEEERPPHY
ncbi:MAG: SlyX family protein [Moraxellaceae bacterium]|jgi:SlyX protein|nr:SlyX family protein [Moraxellaceae bacterium]